MKTLKDIFKGQKIFKGKFFYDWQSQYIMDDEGPVLEIRA
jgi:hypothetical protein